MNASAFKKLDYSLALISTANGGKNFGCIANSLHQVTSSLPPKFTFSLHNDGATCAAVKESGKVAITLLAADCDENIIDEFGYKSGRAVDKFAAFPTETDAAGMPHLKTGMISRLSLTVIDSISVGTHTLFIAEITDAEALTDGEVLTIKAFEKRGMDAPVSAPVIRTLDEHAGWKCSVCGYVRLDDDIPDDFICPICRAPRSKFEKR